MADDRVHFDFGRVQQLSDTQRDYHGRFESVLDEIRSTVAQLLGQWLGEGTEEYKAKQTAFEGNFTELQAFRIALGVDHPPKLSAGGHRADVQGRGHCVLREALCEVP